MAADTRLREAAEYAERGRRFKNFTHTDLVDAWIAAFVKMVANRRDRATIDLVGDLSAEFELRGEEPPYDLLAEQEEQFAAHSLQASSSWNAKSRG
jgi:hypothetical protein